MSVQLLYSGYHNQDKMSYPFTVDANFFYLTSCDLPNILLILHDNHKFVYQHTLEEEFYNRQLYENKLKHCFQAEILSKKQVFDLLQATQHSHKQLTTSVLQSHPEWDVFKTFNLDMEELKTKLSLQREIKQPDEYKLIQQACDYTCDAIQHTMDNCKKGMSEIQLVGLFRYALSTHDIELLAFSPIVSHDKFNQDLHHIPQTDKVKQNSLILMDVGCKYNQYCSDITRCFPVGSKFTNIQTDVYRVVETTLTTVLDALRPGVSWKQLSKLCRLHLVNECIKLKLVEDTEDESTKLEVSYVLMPHSLGHHVGLDYHDCGPIDTLKAGMVLAIEPGLYFQDHATHPKIKQSIWKKYNSVGGVRLEDTVCITDKGHDNLSTLPYKLDKLF